MTIIIDIPVADRFSYLVKGLLTDVVPAVRTGWVAVPLIKLLWWRLRRMTAKFTTIMAQFHAGTLPPPRPARAHPAPAGPAAEPDPPSGQQPTHRPRSLELPRRVGWINQVIPGACASVWRHELEAMLADPKLAASVAGAPQLGGVLRPMCRLMAVKPPPWLRLPRRPRRGPRRATKYPPAPDFLVNAPGAILRPDGSIWMRFGASTLWKPGRGETLEQAQKFDYPRRIWPRDE